jgi:hypothetical protein
MTSWRRFTPTFVGFTTLTLGLALGLPPAEGRAAKASVLRFNITPVLDENPNVADTVSSDGLADSGSYQYADYRVSSLGLNAVPPVCVGAEVTTTSFVFVSLNRAIGAPSIGSNDGQRCSLAGGTPRNWRILIQSVDACTKLKAYDPDYVKEVGSDETWGGITSSCVLTGSDHSRLRFANLYANRLPARTPIAFLISSFTPPPGNGGYEIRSETDALVTGDATMRSFHYDGTARLHEFIGKAQPVGPAFPLRMTAAFVKSTVSQ